MNFIKYMTYSFLRMRWAFPKQRRSCLCVEVSIYKTNNCPSLFYSLHDLNSILYRPKNHNKHNKSSFLYLIYFRFRLTIQLVFILWCIITFFTAMTQQLHLFSTTSILIWITFLNWKKEKRYYHLFSHVYWCVNSNIV